MEDFPPLEIWGGVECTVNRVGQQFIDQLELSGHAQRPHDIDLFADLGITAMRYPILWERIAPQGLAKADWAWADQRLARLRGLRLRPIVGLLHHGSGPLETDLLQDNFAPLLASYARAVAERYPWVDCYTPVNEPLTTARFSGLYGHWYPHQRSNRSFTQTLLNQCRGVVLAMEAIRQIHPGAQLVQTENLGKTHCTKMLAYQAEFENERRWLALDLLLGKVDKQHTLWKYLLGSGANEADVQWFLEHPCPPDILGFNYYVTSERFLDERLEHYPPHLHAGNGQHAYSDVEAVRVRSEGIDGLTALLQEAWDRYRRPLAVTEIHIGCHRESQLRWLLDAWQSGTALRRHGVDLRAITAWSLLGAFDWKNLCTQTMGDYEPGAFDVRSGVPRLTAVGRAIQNLSRGEPNLHPGVPAVGWWQQDQRLQYPTYTTEPAPTPRPVPAAYVPDQRPLLIIGVRGTLGSAFERVCQLRNLYYVGLGRSRLDITDPYAVIAAIETHRPWAVVNAAGYVRVDDAEQHYQECRRINVEGPVNLAAACAARDIPLLTFSSDLVFDGAKRDPYFESDKPRALSVYGDTKLECERRVLELFSDALVVRTSSFFGPWDEFNFVTLALQKLAAGVPVTAAEDWVVSPTYVPHLVHTCLDLLIDGESGVWHLANHGHASWAELAREAATAAGLDRTLIRGCRGVDLKLRACRPVYSALCSHQGVLLPSWRAALQECIALQRARQSRGD